MSNDNASEPRTTVQANGASVWSKLTSGDYSLARTFWLVWFIPLWISGAFLNVAATMSSAIGEAWFGFVLLGVYFAYFGFASLWTWRAANKHPSGWATTAKIWIGLNVALVPLGLILSVVA